ncbi:MAG: ATP-binding protein [Planctomycetota bacterium]|jgi:signal transduction histidine kinase
MLLLLLLVVLVPTACLLWFMNAAMRNERMAVRQKLADAYRPYLDTATRRINEHWHRRADALSEVALELSDAQLFAELVESGACDSALIYDGSGRLTYPAQLQDYAAGQEAPSWHWANAGMLEFELGRPRRAAEAYAEIARSSVDLSTSAQALQAQARCLNKAGDRARAIEILTGPLADDAFSDARDRQGRLIAPNALLLALDLMADSSHPRYADTLERLTERLTDYAEPVLQPTQRRFLARRLEETAADLPRFPVLVAEEMAAAYLAAEPSRPAFSSLVPTGLDDLWQLPSPDRMVVALLKGERVEAEVRSVLETEVPLTNARLKALAPGQDAPEVPPFLSIPVGGYLPNWRVALYLEGTDPSADAAERQIAAYLWTGLIVIATVATIALLMGHYLLRQVRLTRLKNDFIATVSHELKTPLSAMRVLVDTLIEGNYNDQARVGEYLHLVSKENQRLSRLIDNFLTFSRMERNKQVFDSLDVQPGEVVNAAADVVRSRFEAQGCRLDVEVAPDLPPVVGDADALVTMLLNLLDNAFKYSEDDKQIAVRAYASDESICLEVEDNGIGLSSRAARKVFDRFYQVDSSLSRSVGGAGLGLSIVKFIVDAHGGSISVTSRPGEGSVFRVKLPAVRRAATHGT